LPGLRWLAPAWVRRSLYWLQPMPIINPTTPGEQRADLTAYLAILK